MYFFLLYNHPLLAPATINSIKTIWKSASSWHVVSKLLRICSLPWPLQWILSQISFRWHGVSAVQPARSQAAFRKHWRCIFYVVSVTIVTKFIHGIWHYVTQRTLLRTNAMAGDLLILTTLLANCCCGDKGARRQDRKHCACFVKRFNLYRPNGPYI